MDQQHHGWTYLRKASKNSFVVKLGVMLLGVVVLGSVFGVSLTNASAFSAQCPGPNHHFVMPGDTLGKIAMANNTNVATLMTLNHGNITNPNLIYVGQTVCLPGGNAKATNVLPPSSVPSGSVQSMIQQVFGAEAAGALNIARCESGFNASATNPIRIGNSHAAGVFQILYPSTWFGTSQAGHSPYNASANILAAHEIFLRDGHSWREWACQP